jgi:hypothetical protein
MRSPGSSVPRGTKPEHPTSSQLDSIRVMTFAANRRLNRLSARSHEPARPRACRTMLHIRPLEFATVERRRRITRAGRIRGTATVAAGHLRPGDPVGSSCGPIAAGKSTHRRAPACVASIRSCKKTGIGDELQVVRSLKRGLQTSSASGRRVSHEIETHSRSLRCRTSSSHCRLRDGASTYNAIAC